MILLFIIYVYSVKSAEDIFERCNKILEFCPQNSTFYLSPSIFGVLFLKFVKIKDHSFSFILLPQITLQFAQFT